MGPCSRSRAPRAVARRGSRSGVVAMCRLCRFCGDGRHVRAGRDPGVMVRRSGGGQQKRAVGQPRVAIAAGAVQVSQ